MRIALIAFGVIFLVVGGLLFFMPLQTAAATTTTVGDTGVDTRTSYATVHVPLPITYALLLIGAALLVLGFALPDPHAKVVQSAPATTTETQEDITETKETGTEDGRTHKVAHERHARRILKE